MISVRTKAAVWWGKHGTLMILAKQVIKQSNSDM